MRLQVPPVPRASILQSDALLEVVGQIHQRQQPVHADVEGVEDKPRLQVAPSTGKYGNRAIQSAMSTSGHCQLAHRIAI